MSAGTVLYPKMAARPQGSQAESLPQECFSECAPHDSKAGVAQGCAGPSKRHGAVRRHSIRGGARRLRSRESGIIPGHHGGLPQARASGNAGGPGLLDWPGARTPAGGRQEKRGDTGGVQIAVSSDFRRHDCGRWALLRVWQRRAHNLHEPSSIARGDGLSGSEADLPPKPAWAGSLLHGLYDVLTYVFPFDSYPWRSR